MTKINIGDLSKVSGGDGPIWDYGYYLYFYIDNNGNQQTYRSEIMALNPSKLLARMNETQAGLIQKGFLIISSDVKHLEY